MLLERFGSALLMVRMSEQQFYGASKGWARISAMCAIRFNFVCVTFALSLVAWNTQTVVVCFWVS